MDKKTVGIVVDNYKVRAYKRALTKAGYEFKTEPFKKIMTSFIIHTTEDQIPVLYRFCEKMELKTKRSINN